MPGGQCGGLGCSWNRRPGCSIFVEMQGLAQVPRCLTSTVNRGQMVFPQEAAGSPIKGLDLTGVRVGVLVLAPGNVPRLGPIPPHQHKEACSMYHSSKLGEGHERPISGGEGL